ncbi:MAG: L,D-transpeptidase family protein [Syntrophales bacterium]
MKRIISAITVLAAFALLAASDISHAETLRDQVRTQIGDRIGGAEWPSKVAPPEGLPSLSPLLFQFYEEREFQPAWSDDYGLSLDVDDFLEVVRSAYREGLNPEDYHLDKIEAVLSDLYASQIGLESYDVAKLAGLDLILTQAFFLYVSHMVDGRVDHQNIYPDWVVNERSADLVAVLNEALESGEMQKTLAYLAPPYSRYAGLKEKLMRYQAIAESGGWPQVPGGAKLQRGSRGERVAILRQRLIISGDLASTVREKPNIFDHDLELAVRKFQRRHGLKDDGRVGKSTLKDINVPAETRIRQIALNMDRLRWLSDDMGRNYIFVNIADFSLEVMENEQPLMAMRIIAGKDEQRSCVLSAKMTYLELNPFWRIPDSIAAKEILPQVKKEARYLAQKNIKVFKAWKDNAKEINPMLVSWSRIRASNLGYKFRQEPGPQNPLGKIKFIFPNECEIYLHDTPARHLFGRARRDLSHGCIRVEKPVELATYLLRNKETWIQKKILAEIKKGKRQVVMLPEPVNVHIFYGTVWVDRDGVLQFRDDIYHADEIPYDPPLKRGHVTDATQ